MLPSGHLLSPVSMENMKKGVIIWNHLDFHIHFHCKHYPQKAHKGLNLRLWTKGEGEGNPYNKNSYKPSYKSSKLQGDRGRLVGPELLIQTIVYVISLQKKLLHTLGKAYKLANVPSVSKLTLNKMTVPLHFFYFYWGESPPKYPFNWGWVILIALQGHIAHMGGISQGVQSMKIMS